MIHAQEILFEVAGQELVLEVDAVIASVTSVDVFEQTTDFTATPESATSGVAAVDSTSTTTSAAAGEGEDVPELVPVVSAAGFVHGRRYLISKAGRTELFELEAIDGTNLYTRQPLRNAFATGAAITGARRATIGVSATWAADITKLSNGAAPNARWVARWIVQLSDPSEPMVFYRNFDLVRVPAQPPVTPLDVDDAFPGWLDKLPPDHQRSQGRSLIREATRAVRLDLWKDGIIDRALRDAEVYAELVIAKTLFLTLRQQRLAGAADVGQLDEARAAYEERRTGLVRSPVLALDRGSGGGATTTQGRGGPLTVR